MTRWWLDIRSILMLVVVLAAAGRGAATGEWDALWFALGAGGLGLSAPQPRMRSTTNTGPQGGTRTEAPEGPRTGGGS